MSPVKIVVKRREKLSRKVKALYTAVAILVSFLIAAPIVAALGINPILFYKYLIVGSFAPYSIPLTIINLIPVALCCISAIVSFRAGLWNIGQDGQYIMGAVFLLWIASLIPNVPPPLSYVLVVILGGIAGGAWCLICGVLRAYTEANEAVTTLMMLYIASSILNYLCYGPWRSSIGFPETFPLPQNYQLPNIGPITSAIIALAVLTFLAWLILDRTRLGLEMSILAEGTRVIDYIGLRYRRLICIVMFLSGFYAGAAGSLYLSYAAKFLEPGFIAYYGFSGIIAAWLCELKVEYSILASLLLAALYSSSYTMQATLNIPSYMIDALEGLLLICILLVHFFTRYRVEIRFISSSSKSSRK
ncbi:MAG: ABC transporter permease [Crenarchaeota archaeon]|nr:ABC transporter permease [Thermoproteota archaeon]